MSITNFICGSIKQVFLMTLMPLILFLWTTNLDIFEDGISFLISFLFIIIIESILYVNLPIDLIPDWIPIIGKLDDGLAYLSMVLSIWLLIFIGLYYLLV
jgi:hypothetical protein